MKYRLFLTVFFLIVGTVLFGQSLVETKGTVVDISGKAVAGATVTAVGTKITLKTTSNGSFEARFPSTVKYLRIQKAGFVSQSVPVRSSIRVVLKTPEQAATQSQTVEEKNSTPEKSEKQIAEEKAALEQAKKMAVEKAAKQEAERQERILAEKKAAEQAENERLAAEKRAREQEERRIAAEKAAAEETMKLEAAKKAAEAKLAAEQAERKLAEQRAIEQSEAARLAAEQLQEVQAENERLSAEIAAAEEIEVAKAEKKKQSGFQHTIGISYFCTSPLTVYYRTLGERTLTLHPLMIDYLIGYRFGSVLSTGIGVGYLKGLTPIVVEGEDDEVRSETYYGGNRDLVALPVYANAKACFGKGRFHPLINVSGGVWFDNGNTTPLLEVGTGFEIRKGYRSGTQLMVTYVPKINTYDGGGVRLKFGWMF